MISRAVHSGKSLMTLMGQVNLLIFKLYRNEKHNMIPFCIMHENKPYEVFLTNKRSFMIIQDGNRFGTISPEAGDFKLEWESEDIKDKNLVCELGELISAHQIGNITL